MLSASSELGNGSRIRGDLQDACERNLRRPVCKRRKRSRGAGQDADVKSKQQDEESRNRQAQNALTPRGYGELKSNHMENSLPLYPRIFAVVPSPSGFGIAVVEGVNSLVDWDVKRVRKNLNHGCMERVGKAVEFFEPHVLVMEDGARRSPRVRRLMRRITMFAKKRSIRVVVLSREQVRRTFFLEGFGNKDAVAALLAKRYPEELGPRLPPKRRAWMSEDHRMAMFSAVALALAFRFNRKSLGL